MTTIDDVIKRSEVHLDEAFKGLQEAADLLDGDSDDRDDRDINRVRDAIHKYDSAETTVKSLRKIKDAMERMAAGHNVNLNCDIKYDS